MWIHGEEMEKAFHAEGPACEKHGGENVGAWETYASSKEPGVQAGWGRG